MSLVIGSHADVRQLLEKLLTIHEFVFLLMMRLRIVSV